MSDPTRGLGPRARAIVEDGRELDEPSERDRARVRARLAATLGVSALAAAGTQTAAAAASASGGLAAEVATASGAASGTLEAAAISSSGWWSGLGALGGKGLISLIGAAAIGTAVGTAVVLRDGAPTAGPQATSAARTPQTRPARPQATTAPAPAPRAALPAASRVSTQPSAASLQPPAAGTRRLAAPAPRSPAPATSLPLVQQRAARGPGQVVEAPARADGATHDAPSPSPPQVAAQRTALAPLPAEPPQVAPKAPLVAAAPAAVAAASSAPNAPVAAASSTPLSAAKPAPVAKAPALAGELKLLAAAQQALREQQWPRALALLDEHAAQFPRGALRPERLAARAVVLCRMGETAAGQSALQRLESETPTSPLRGWARDACNP